MASGERSCQLFLTKSSRVATSGISVVISIRSPTRTGASTNFMNSSGLFQKYVFPRHSMDAIADQFITVVNDALAAGARLVAHRSVTTGCRDGSHSKPCDGIANEGAPTFSPNVNNA